MHPQGLLVGLLNTAFDGRLAQALVCLCAGMQHCSADREPYTDSCTILSIRGVLRSSQRTSYLWQPENP